MHQAYCETCEASTDHKEDVCRKCGTRQTMVERFREYEGMSTLDEIRNDLVGEEMRLPPTPQIFGRPNGRR